jgi:hypothetical protein
VTSDVLRSIFSTSTPIHDGAVIIQGDRISCASAYFPPTNLELPSRYGARHRAALGISEITDSITIVVSEETGKISIAEEGSLLPMTEAKLRAYLNKMIIEEEIEVEMRKDKTKRGFFTGKVPVEVVEEDTPINREKASAKAKEKKPHKSFFSRKDKPVVNDGEAKEASHQTVTQPEMFEEDQNLDKPEEVKDYPENDQRIEVERVETGNTTQTKVDDLLESSSLEPFDDDNTKEGGES